MGKPCTGQSQESKSLTDEEVLHGSDTALDPQKKVTDAIVLKMDIRLLLQLHSWRRPTTLQNLRIRLQRAADFTGCMRAWKTFFTDASGGGVGMARLVP